MNILIIGDDVNFKESQSKFGEGHSYTLQSNQLEAGKIFRDHDVIFDFCIDRDRSQIAVYKDRNVTAFLNTSKISLSQLGASGTLFGFAGLPSFLNREILETSLYKPELISRLEDICKKLNTKFQLVGDRVGLVTPRVICMIINEAYFTVEEGTATREDIDLAMKLGTNYPFGPFEWCTKIGGRNVIEVLEAVYADTKDERYKISPLLAKEFLLNRN